MTGLATDTNIDIEILVGEMPVKGCEHSRHNNQACHADGNEKYVKVAQPCGCDVNITIYCGKYIEYIFRHGDHEMMCKLCLHQFPLRQAIHVLGPANKGTEK